MTLRIPTNRIPADIGTLSVPSSRPSVQTVVPGNGWEVVVLSHADFHTELAVLPRWTTLQFSKVLKDKGAGTITMNLDDPVFSSKLGDGSGGTALIDFENLWQVWYNGVLVFDFFGETVTEQLLDQSEERVVTITGPGTIACLGWASAMPPGFPTIKFKTDAIQDGFAEIDLVGSPALDTNLWNASAPLADITLNPLGTCQLTGTANGTFLGATPFDLTNSLISAQVTPIPQGGINGSQVSQFIIQDNNSPAYALFGVTATGFYMQFKDAGGHTDAGCGVTKNSATVTDTHIKAADAGELVSGPGIPANAVITSVSAGVSFVMNVQATVTTASATVSVGGKVQTKALGNFDANGDANWQFSYAVGNLYFWTSADGQSWVKQWVIPTGWSPNDVTVQFACYYTPIGTESPQVMQLTNINGNVVTPTSAGNIFLSTPCLAVWRSLFDDAQARGTIPFVTCTFTESGDSFGNPWQDAISQQVTLGTDMYSLLQSFCGIVNADYCMQPGFQLQVGLTLSIDTGVMLGSNLSRTVIFREGGEEQTKQRVRARDAIANLIGAVNSDGTVVSDADAASAVTYQQREQWIQTAAQVNPKSMAIVAAATLADSKDETLSWTLNIDPTKAGHVPFIDFDAGDWVGMERPGIAGNTIDAIRVIGIAVSVDAQGLVTCELTLNSYRQWLAEQLLYISSKFGGQFINALGTTPVTTNATNPGQLPIVIAPTLGGLSDTSIQ